jgi:polysaccharide biosynthesis transport protein
MVPGRRYTPRYVANLLRRHWFAVSAPILIFGGLAVLLAKALPNVYYSQATIQILPSRIPENLVKTTVVAPLPERLREAREQLLSESRVEEIVKELDLLPTVRERLPTELIVGAMRRAVRTELVSKDTVVLGVSGYEPDKVAKLAERLLADYIEISVKDRTVLAESTSQFLETELEAARERLLVQERKVQSYREQHAGELPSEVDTNLRMMQTSYVQMQGVVEALRQDRERRNALERAINDALPAASDVDSDGAPVEEPTAPSQTATASSGDEADPLKLPPGPPSKQLVAARAIVEALKLRLTSEHPDMQRAERLIKRLEAEAAGAPAAPDRRADARAAHDARLRQAQDELSRLNQQIAAREALEMRLRDAVAGYQNRVEAVPERVSEWTDLTRDYGTTQQVYAGLLAKREEARIAASLERQRAHEQFKVVGLPQVPTAPVSPNRPAIALLGLMLGFGLAVASVALFEVKDTTIRAENEVLTNLGIPVLAMVPIVRTVTDRRRARRRKVTLSAAAALVVVLAVALRWF